MPPPRSSYPPPQTHSCLLWPLQVRVVDQMSATWPRHEAAPDSNHWVRRKQKRRMVTQVTKRGPRAATFPPDHATCYGDAGMAVARALRDEIEGGGPPRLSP